jgi:dynein heavy chain
VCRNDKIWKQWFDKDAPEEEVIPDGYNNTLDVFRRLLLVRSWCPDRTLPQAKRYIADSMGQAYAEGVILDLEKMAKESTCRTPMICLLSLGSDPTTSIENLAKKNHLGQYHCVVGWWTSKFIFLSFSVTMIRKWVLLSRGTDM